MGKVRPDAHWTSKLMELHYSWKNKNLFNSGYFFFSLLLPLEVITTPLSNRTRKTAFLAMQENTQLRIILAGRALNHFFLSYFFLHLNTSKPYFSNIILQDNTIQIIFLLATIKLYSLRTKNYLIIKKINYLKLLIKSKRTFNYFVGGDMYGRLWRRWWKWRESRRQWRWLVNC